MHTLSFSLTHTHAGNATSQHQSVQALGAVHSEHVKNALSFSTRTHSLAHTHTCSVAPRHQSVPALGAVYESVTREIAMMAERMVGLEKEREELHEGARWRAQQMTVCMYLYTYVYIHMCIYIYYIYFIHICIQVHVKCLCMRVIAGARST